METFRRGFAPLNFKQLKIKEANRYGKTVAIRPLFAFRR